MLVSTVSDTDLPEHFCTAEHSIAENNAKYVEKRPVYVIYTHDWTSTMLFERGSYR